MERFSEIEAYITPTWNERFAEDRKKIAYFGIHFLRSSHLNRNYDCEIKLYNETLYSEENRAAGYWYPEFLYRFAADKEEMLKREIYQGKTPRNRAGDPVQIYQ